MGYTIRDVDGFVADGPTISGWRLLRDQVLLPQGGDATLEFVTNGISDRPEELRAELELMVPTPGNEGWLDFLLKAVDDCDEFVVLSDGTAGDVKDPDELPEDKAYLT